MEQDRILFEERQYFRQAWLWWVIGITTVSEMAIIITLAISDQESSEGWLALGVFTAVLLPVFMILYFSNLRTVYSEKGILYRFKPFHFKSHFIPWSEVEKSWIRKYKPLSEYGGWGIKWGFSKRGKAYNVDGDMGLQLELKNGKKVLFGTARPDDMQKALDHILTGPVEVKVFTARI